jgi:hypothetical protein
MTFDESNVRRHSSGQFAEKHGSAPELTLGQDGTRMLGSTVMLYEGNGVYREEPKAVSEEMRAYNRQVAEARRRADAVAALYNEDMELYEHLSADDDQDTIDRYQKIAQQYRDIAAFERQWVEEHDGELPSFVPNEKKSREFARAVRERFDITPVRYVQLLNRVPDVARLRENLIEDGATEKSAALEAIVQFTGGRPPRPRFLTKRQQDEDFDRWESQHEAEMQRGFG